MLSRKVVRFRGGLVFKAHRLLYHSTLGLRKIKKNKSWETWAGKHCFNGAGHERASPLDHELKALRGN